MKKKTLILSLTAFFMLGLMPDVHAEEGNDFEDFTPIHASFGTEEDNKESFAQYVDHLLGEQMFSQEEDVTLATGKNAYDALSDSDKKMYDAILPYLKKIANGELSRASFDILMSDLQVTNTELQEIWADVGLNGSNMAFIKALIYDVPYDLFWFDKTVGVLFAYKENEGFWIGFEVSDEFNDETVTKVSDLPTEYHYGVDSSTITAVPAAVQNAKDIVEEYKDKEDELEILRAYAEKISELVDYNHEAANSDNNTYGNPWQLIWVFDDNPDTKVVCEGYSKAFQYLCDLSTFDDVIGTVSATGTLTTSKSEGHMFNIVKIRDHGNYLVDVTNSDSDNDGFDGKLFMKGATKDTTDGSYFVEYDEINKYKYAYDTDTIALLSDYVELESHDYPHDFQSEIVISARCDTKGSEKFTCKDCQKEVYREIPMLPHTVVTDSEKAATCTSTGLTEGSHCSVCETVIVPQETISALGHEFGDWVTTKQPSNEADGKRMRVCSHGCGEEESETIHVWNTAFTIDKPATCTTKGSKSKHCKNCAEKKEITDIPVIAHKQVATVTKPATCTTDGTRTYKCSVCSKVLRTDRIARTSHTYAVATDRCTKCSAYRPEISTAVPVMKVKSISRSKNYITVKWTKNKKVKGYVVRYSVSPIMTGAKSYTISKYKTVSKKITKLKRKTAYYVQIRAFQNIGGVNKYGVWSTVRVVNTK